MPGGVRGRTALGAALALSAALALGTLMVFAQGAAAPGQVTTRTHPLTLVTPGTVRTAMSESTATSSNWSGYVVCRDAGCDTSAGTFTSVSGCWSVPAVSGPDGSYSSAWIGIDGVTNSDLIQTGTEQDYSGGVARYGAWWEILPAASTPIAMTVTAGDAMCATITDLGGGSWSIALDDVTTHASFNMTTAYSGPADSAEWIVEAPELCGHTCSEAALADYGQVSFSSADANGAAADLAGGIAVTMVDPNGGATSTPSAPSGNSFTVTYGGPSPTPTPTPTPTSTPTPTPTATPTPTPTPTSTPTPTPAPGGPPAGATAYTALTPFRVCDTRPATATPCSGQAIGGGATLTVQVTGRTGASGQSVPSSAISVVLNVTAIQGSAGTYLSLYPAGTARPVSSTLNVAAGSIQANLAVVLLGAGGAIEIHNAAGTINVALDVEGYFAAPAAPTAAPGLFHPIAPLRICDTRSGTGTACSGTPLGPGRWTRVVVSGCPTGNPSCAASIPADGTATGASLNLTAVAPTRGTYLSVAPTSPSGTCPGGPAPFSNVNVARGAILPNRVMTALGPTTSGGPAEAVCVYNSAGTVNVILDLNGWFGSGAETSPGAYFVSVSPFRLCDTRSAAVTGYTTECSGHTLGAGSTLPVGVAGVDGIPGSGAADPAVALIANVTAVLGSAGTYLTLYPADTALPTASDLNAAPGQIVANLVVVSLATGGAGAGAVDLFNDRGRIDAILDVEGWFEG